MYIFTTEYTKIVFPHTGLQLMELKHSFNPWSGTWKKIIQNNGN